MDKEGWILPEHVLSAPAKQTLEVLIEQAKQAHHCDVMLRINGEDRWFQADWIKYLQPIN